MAISGRTAPNLFLFRAAHLHTSIRALFSHLPAFFFSILCLSSPVASLAASQDSLSSSRPREKRGKRKGGNLPATQRIKEWGEEGGEGLHSLTFRAIMISPAPSLPAILFDAQGRGQQLGRGGRGKELFWEGRGFCDKRHFYFDSFRCCRRRLDSVSTQRQKIFAVHEKNAPFIARPGRRKRKNGRVFEWPLRALYPDTFIPPPLSPSVSQERKGGKDQCIDAW